QVIAFRGMGDQWAERGRVAAGNDPTGLSIERVVEGGQVRFDLLVGNTFGDVLRLVGNGDGTFQASRRDPFRVTLAVQDLDGDGKPDVVLADERLDRVTVRSGASLGTQLDVKTGLLSPGAVRLADLNGDGHPDLIVC